MVRRGMSRAITATLLFAVSLALVAGGCGDAGDSSTVSLSDGTSAPRPGTSAGPATRAGETTTPGSATTSSSPPSTLIEEGYRATTVVQDLRVPWEMRFLRDGRLLITEREGRIVLADVGSGSVTEVGRIDAAARGEAGLMGLALDPDFPDNPTIYVSYTHSDGEGIQNRLSSFELNGLDTSSPKLGEETILLDGIPAASNHDGSRVAFGPDGYLWMTMGDAGDGDRAQRMDTLSGKVLRMTREGRPAPDNPFLDRPYPFSLIYTLGHRNPQGLAFHPETGTAYVTEHGPSDNDEINRLEAGGNYGWPDLRGKAGETGFVDPIATWSPTIAPAGCIFFSDGALSDLNGMLLFVTLKGSDLRALVPDDSGDFVAITDERVLFDEQFGRLRAIAQGPDGALYIATSNYDGRGDPGPLDDRVVRIEPAG